MNKICACAAIDKVDEKYLELELRLREYAEMLILLYPDNHKVEEDTDVRNSIPDPR